VSATSRGQRSAEWLIHAACRRLPPDVRADRCREWTAELPAILGDESIRLSLLRALRALAFCVGISRTTRQLSRSWRASSRRTRNSQWASGALRTGPNNIVGRLVVGIAVELVFVAAFITVAKVLATGSDPQPWPLLLFAAPAVAFDAFCLADIARAADVRYLRKWAWAGICLVQMPLGGIIYLSIGRVRPARPVPPGGARA
jgi:hypothetical protein